MLDKRKSKKKKEIIDRPTDILIYKADKEKGENEYIINTKNHETLWKYRNIYFYEFCSLIDRLTDKIFLE